MPSFYLIYKKEEINRYKSLVITCIHALYYKEYFGYHINMKISSAIKYRNLFILATIFCVLCLSPLADIHLEGSTETRSYTHGQDHNETIFSMLIHELLFTQLRHTLDDVTLGFSHRDLKANKSISSKGKASTSYPQVVCISIFETITVHLLKGVALLHNHKRVEGTFFQKYSGLSPPFLFC